MSHEALQEQNKKARMWSTSGTHFSPCEAAVPQLPPGNYRIVLSNRGLYFVKREIQTDDLLQLPDSATEHILNAMRVFWSREKAYRDYGFIWKRGILLYGPPGGGKTSTVELLAKIIINELKGVVVHVDDPRTAIHGLEAFRFIEPKTPLLLVMEDIDAMIENSSESALLNLLDGEFQTDNVVVVATTNYPERLDKRIRDRPSRFDILMNIDLPSDAAREEFLRRTHLRFGDEVLSEEVGKELETWVASTKGFSVAHLKELIIAVEVLGGEFKSQLARIKGMMSSRPSSDGDRGRLGFT